MPENRNGESKAVNDMETIGATDKREVIDGYRVSPELPLKRYAENRNELKTPTRPFPYMAGDAGMKSQAVDGKGDGLPDHVGIDATTFPRVILGKVPEDNKKLER